MSLIADLEELERSCARMRLKARQQQMIYFQLIEQIVRLHQKHRLARDFAVSDELRAALNSVGVTIHQGSAGYARDAIPAALRSAPLGDTWTITSTETQSRP